jgi:hypothetical protein
MSQLTNTPQNTAYLQPTKYLLTFDRIGSVKYFCQTINIPGMSLPEIKVNTPFLDINSPGTKLNFNTLTINWIVDESLDSWKQIYNWFFSIASPNGYTQRTRLSQQQNNNNYLNPNHPINPFSDGILTVLSALNNPLIRIQFYNLFPTTLSDIDFDVKQSAEDVITGSATFAYDYFEFIS